MHLSVYYIINKIIYRILLWTVFFPSQRYDLVVLTRWWKCVCVCVCVCTRMLSPFTVSHSLRPRLLCSWDSPDKNTGVGCQALLQGIFPTQRSNLSSCGSCIGRQIPYPWAADATVVHSFSLLCVNMLQCIDSTLREWDDCQDFTDTNNTAAHIHVQVF